MRILTFLLALMVAGVGHADGWLCASDKVAGFKFDRETKEYSVSSFSPMQYVVRKSTVPAGGWEVVRAGEDFSMTWCEDTESKFLECEGIYQLKMSKTSLRFTLLFSGFYLSSDAEMKEKMELDPGKRDDIALVIGRCTPI